MSSKPGIHAVPRAGDTRRGSKWVGENGGREEKEVQLEHLDESWLGPYSSGGARYTDHPLLPHYPANWFLSLTPYDTSTILYFQFH